MDRLVYRETDRFDMCIVAIDVVVMMGVMMMVLRVTVPPCSMLMVVRFDIGFRLQPVLDVEALGFRVVEAGMQQCPRIDGTVLRNDLRGCRVQGAKAILQSAQHIAIDEIGLCQEQPVRHRCLFDGFYLTVECIGSVHRIYHSDNPVQTIALHHVRVGHQRMEDRSRVREAGCLDDNSIEVRLSFPRKAMGRFAQGVYEIAPDRAAKTPARHLDDDIVFALGHEIMVETDLAKLIDEHKRSAQRRLLHQMVQNGRLAAAQKPGQD